LVDETIHARKTHIIRSSGILSSQVYEWQRQIRARKQRALNLYAEEVNAAVGNIIDYPHMGGKKGTLMLVYHHTEYLGQRCYDFVKNQIKQIITEELRYRHLERSYVSWPKITAQHFGDIWCADYTQVLFFGQIIYIAVVLDDFSHYYLGHHVSDQADTELVDGAFINALKTCIGVLPRYYMQSDQGSPYKAEVYQEHVALQDIKQIFIPKGTPWNNGEAEVGMRDIKALFYKEYAHTTRAQHLDTVSQAQLMATKIFKELNERIPRLKLKGVTPMDVVQERAEAKRISMKKFTRERIEKRKSKTRIEDLKNHLIEKLCLEKVNNRQLKNLDYLLNHRYHKVSPVRV